MPHCFLHENFAFGLAILLCGQSEKSVVAALILLITVLVLVILIVLIVLVLLIAVLILVVLIVLVVLVVLVLLITVLLFHFRNFLPARNFTVRVQGTSHRSEINRTMRVWHESGNVIRILLKKK